MSLKSTTRHVGGVTILDLTGSVTLGDGSDTLREQIRDLVNGGARKVLLNLEGVDFLDSSGMAELVAAFTAVQSAGGDLKLINVTKKVSDRLVITKLATVLDVQPDESAAVASFL